jgi:hypothetical protein
MFMDSNPEVVSALRPMSVLFADFMAEKVQPKATKVCVSSGGFFVTLEDMAIQIAEAYKD